MSVTAVTFTGVAQAARSVLQAAIPSASVYDYAPSQGFNLFPVIFFLPPNFERKAADEAESQLGSVDLRLEFTLMAFVLDNAQGEGGRNAEDEAAQLMGEIIGAIDDRPGLGLISGLEVIEAVVAAGEFQRAEVAMQNTQGGQPVVGYEARLDVLTLVNQ